LVNCSWPYQPYHTWSTCLRKHSKHDRWFSAFALTN